MFFALGSRRGAGIYGPRARRGAAGVAFAPLCAAAPVELSVPQGLRGGATTGVTGGAVVSVLLCVARVDTAVVRRHVALVSIDER